MVEHSPKILASEETPPPPCLIRIRLKIAKKYCLFWDIFSSVKMNVFHPFFAFRFKMNIRCDNQFKTVAGGGELFSDSRCCLIAWVSAF